MEFKKADISGLAAIKQIFAEGRASLASRGVKQWQNGYPTDDIILGDIAANRLYVCTENGVILGVCAVMLDGEPTYDRIYEGAWLTDTKYGAVHRVAVSESAKRGGVASYMLKKAEEITLAAGMSDLRIDTHRDNLPMRGMIEKNGFLYCGIIYLEDGDPRVAYEKKL